MTGSPRRYGRIGLLCAAVVWSASHGARADAPRVHRAGPSAPDRQARVAAALASVPKVQDAVAALRKEKFKARVPAAYQEQGDFRKYVVKEIAADLPAAKREMVGRVALHLGLLKASVDLGRTLEDAMVSQAGAYYDPATKTFYVVMVPSQAMALDVASAHELTHALQDQRFDLVTYYGGRGNGAKLSEDEQNARRFVVEGEGTLVMLAYQIQATSQQNPLDGPASLALQMSVGAMAQMDVSMLAGMVKQQAAALPDLGGDIKAALESMDKIPPYILVPLYDSYSKGALTVMEAYNHGGWGAVDELFKRPPESTEQVLHPREKLVGHRDPPVRVSLSPLGPALAGWDQVHEDVLGELLWRVYFSNWGEASGPVAAAGWGGDRYRVLLKGPGQIVQLATVWDTETDAQEFEAAYRRTLAARFPGSSESPGARRGGAGGVVSRKLADGDVVLVERRGKRVSIVDHAEPDLAAAALANLWTATAR